jgi:hypothetical protein
MCVSVFTSGRELALAQGTGSVRVHRGATLRAGSAQGRRPARQGVDAACHTASQRAGLECTGMAVTKATAPGDWIGSRQAVINLPHIGRRGCRHISARRGIGQLGDR